MITNADLIEVLENKVTSVTDLISVNIDDEASGSSLELLGMIIRLLNNFGDNIRYPE